MPTQWMSVEINDLCPTSQGNGLLIRVGPAVIEVQSGITQRRNTNNSGSMLTDTDVERVYLACESTDLLKSIDELHSSTFTFTFMFRPDQRHRTIHSVSSSACSLPSFKRQARTYRIALPGMLSGSSCLMAAGLLMPACSMARYICRRIGHGTRSSILILFSATSPAR